MGVSVYVVMDQLNLSVQRRICSGFLNSAFSATTSFVTLLRAIFPVGEVTGENKAQAIDKAESQGYVRQVACVTRKNFGI